MLFMRVRLRVHACACACVCMVVGLLIKDKSHKFEGQCGKVGEKEEQVIM